MATLPSITSMAGLPPTDLGWRQLWYLEFSSYPPSRYMSYPVGYENLTNVSDTISLAELSDQSTLYYRAVTNALATFETSDNARHLIRTGAEKILRQMTLTSAGRTKKRLQLFKLDKEIDLPDWDCPTYYWLKAAVESNNPEVVSQFLKLAWTLNEEHKIVRVADNGGFNGHNIYRSCAEIFDQLTDYPNKEVTDDSIFDPTSNPEQFSLGQVINADAVHHFITKLTRTDLVDLLNDCPINPHTANALKIILFIEQHLQLNTIARVRKFFKNRATDMSYFIKYVTTEVAIEIVDQLLIAPDGSRIKLDLGLAGKIIGQSSHQIPFDVRIQLVERICNNRDLPYELANFERTDWGVMVLSNLRFTEQQREELISRYDENDHTVYWVHFFNLVRFHSDSGMRNFCYDICSLEDYQPQWTERFKYKVHDDHMVVKAKQSGMFVFADGERIDCPAGEMTIIPRKHLFIRWTHRG